MVSILNTVFRTEEAPSSAFGRGLLKALVWVLAIFIGGMLGLLAIILLAPWNMSIRRLFSLLALNLAMLALLWLKYPWARRPLPALMFGASSGLGAMVGSFLVFGTSVLSGIFGDWGTPIGIFALGFCAICALGAWVFRRGGTSTQEKERAG